MKQNYFKNLLAALLLLCSTAVMSQRFWIDGICYSIITDKTVALWGAETFYNNREVVIPATVIYNDVAYSVTSIGDGAFWRCTGLTSIEIPNSVTSIGAGAFYECTGLTSIVIPNSVTSIDDGAFEFCSGLKSVTIGDGVTSIGQTTFFDCRSLTSVVIGNSVTSIGVGAFADCYNLTSIVIPNSVTSIGEITFLNCRNLTSVVIGNSVTSIEERAFQYCSGLTSVISHIPADKLFVPGENAFPDICKTNCTLYVPYGTKEIYAATEGWSEFENIVEMTHELNVTAAGYATLYLGYAAEIPAGVEVYTANAVEDDRLKMQPVEGVIPANTGVIVKAAAGTYTFNNADDAVAAIEGNLFKGSLKDETVKVASGKAAYVLSMVDGEVGMYRAELTNHSFLNNANKAYLLLDSNNLGVYDEELDTSAGGQLSNGYRFDFGGITGIENVKGESGEVKTIYDLSGRAVENPSKGLYIINGKKVLVK